MLILFFSFQVIAQSSKDISSTKPIPRDTKDELFIDADSLDEDSDIKEIEGDHTKDNDEMMMLDEEGSGMDPSTKGTGAEDMESSGSGYGPDDEDAQVNGNTKGKIDSDEEDDDIDDDDEEEEDDDELVNNNEDFKEKPQKPTTTTTSTTSSTIRTPKIDDEESTRYIDLVCYLNYLLTYLSLLMVTLILIVILYLNQVPY